jgi:hypothetical protein
VREALKNERTSMADRSPEKQDALLGTGDAVLGLPIPEGASEHYLQARRATEAAIEQGKIKPLDLTAEERQAFAP